MHILHRKGLVINYVSKGLMTGFIQITDAIKLKNKSY